MALPEVEQPVAAEVTGAAAVEEVKNDVAPAPAPAQAEETNEEVREARSETVNILDMFLHVLLDV